LRTLFAAAAKLEKIVPDRIQRLRAAMAANDISLQLLASDIQSLKDKLAAESTRVSAQAASAKAESVDMAERAAEHEARDRSQATGTSAEAHSHRERPQPHRAEGVRVHGRIHAAFCRDRAAIEGSFYTLGET
jgi:Tfp pilus assembly protein PilN